MAKAKNIVTSITVEIDAPVSVVWQVLTDLDRYPEWNPFTARIDSTFKLGDPVHLHIPTPGKTPADGKLMVYTEYLVAFEPEQLLSWEKRPTEDDKNAARRDQYLEKISEEKTRYFNTDIFLGVNQDSIMKLSGAWVQMSFDNVARALKKQAEKVYAEQRAQA